MLSSLYLAFSQISRPVELEEYFMTNSAGKLAARNKIAGGNRMELLLFRLKGKQLYGINVFKVKEIIPCPRLTSLPHHTAEVRGVAHVREGTISIVDLGMAIRQPPMENPRENFVIVTEYNRRTQGFLVREVDRIVNIDWEEVHPPPKGSGRNSFLTAITQMDNQLIEIIDVEKIIASVDPFAHSVSSEILTDDIKAIASQFHILLVDDSSVARNQVERNLSETGVQFTSLTNGREALDYLNGLADEGLDIRDQFLMIISDIEMPEMDGYTLTNRIKQDPRLCNLTVLLHSSLSGVFNEAMVKKVGADFFLAKYNADELARVVIGEIQKAAGLKR